MVSDWRTRRSLEVARGPRGVSPASERDLCSSFHLARVHQLQTSTLSPAIKKVLIAPLSTTSSCVLEEVVVCIGSPLACSSVVSNTINCDCLQHGPLARRTTKNVDLPRGCNEHDNNTSSESHKKEKVGSRTSLVQHIAPTTSAIRSCVFLCSNAHGLFEISSIE